MSAVPTLFPRETEQLHLNCHGHGLGRSLHTAELTLAEDPSFGCQINVPPCEVVSRLYVSIALQNDRLVLLVLRPRQKQILLTLLLIYNHIRMNF